MLILPSYPVYVSPLKPLVMPFAEHTSFLLVMQSALRPANACLRQARPSLIRTYSYGHIFSHSAALSVSDVGCSLLAGIRTKRRK